MPGRAGRLRAGFRGNSPSLLPLLSWACCCPQMTGGRLASPHPAGFLPPAVVAGSRPGGWCACVSRPRRSPRAWVVRAVRDPGAGSGGVGGGGGCGALASSPPRACNRWACPRNDGQPAWHRPAARRRPCGAERQGWLPGKLGPSAVTFPKPPFKKKIKGVKKPPRLPGQARTVPGSAGKRPFLFLATESWRAAAGSARPPPPLAVTVPSRGGCRCPRAFLWGRGAPPHLDPRRRSRRSRLEAALDACLRSFQ